MSPQSKRKPQDRPKSKTKKRQDGWFSSLKHKIWSGIAGTVAYALAGIQGLFPSSPNWIYLLGASICALVMWGTHEWVICIKEEQSKQQRETTGKNEPQSALSTSGKGEEIPLIRLSPDELRGVENVRALGDRFLLDSNDPIGGGRSAEEPISARIFSVRLVNASTPPIILISGKWKAGRDGKEFPLFLNKGGDLVPSNSLQKIPYGLDVGLVCALTNNPSAEGITLDEFTREWSPLSLSLLIDGQPYEVTWGEADIAKARVSLERQLALPDKRPGTEWK